MLPLPTPGTDYGAAPGWADDLNGAIEDRAISPRTINAQTGTAYTLVADDEGVVVTLDNAAAITLTVPTNAAVAFPVGAVIEGIQLGAGQVTIVGDTGVTVSGAPGPKVAAQYGVFALQQVAADTWVAFGRLAA